MATSQGCAVALFCVQNRRFCKMKIANFCKNNQKITNFCKLFAYIKNIL